MIAGTIDQKTGEVLSVFQAVLKGLIDYDTGIRLLETQLMISGLISPELRKCFDLKEAKHHGLIDEQVLCQLEELNQAKEIISAVSSPTIPVLDALAQGRLSEPMAIRVLEILVSTGFLVVPATGEQLTLQKAFQQYWLSSALFSKVLERQNMCKDLIDPCTSEKVSLVDILQRSILQENTGLRLLPVRPQEGGRITLKCGRKISILRAAHEGLIDRETMFRLLGAQLLSGGLIACNSGQRMTVEEAVAEGVIDRDTAHSILMYQVRTGGIIHSNPAKRLTVDEAVQCDLITSSSALLVLEAQRGYVGLIWPHSGEIFPTSFILQQGLITNELAYKILNGRQKIAALYIPETSQVIDLDVAKQLGIIDNNTASILKSIILPDKMPELEDLEACKNARGWLFFCKFHPFPVDDYRQEEDVSDGEEPVTTPSSEQTKLLFLSYLMINSYMDANTGQRLLLYDGDLNEAVAELLEGCSTGRGEDLPVKERLDVLRLPDVFLSNASGTEKDESTTSPNSFDKYHCKEPKEIPENRNHAIDEELNEMGNNATRNELHPSEDLANVVITDNKVKNSSNVCVPNPVSYLTGSGLAEVSMLRQDPEHILEKYKNQSQVETNEHADGCSHSKNIQNFASDLIINPIVKSKTSRICDLNETEKEDNMSKDSAIFDYSPRLSALLSHDKLRNDQGSGNDVHTTENHGNKCEAPHDQTMLLGQRVGETFQDQFLGIAAISISLQGEPSQQKSVNIGTSACQVQYHNDKCISDTYGEDEKMHAVSPKKPADEQSESKVEEYTFAVTSKGHSDNTSHVCGAPLCEETISAGDYETSLLDDQQRVSETDTESDDDFYDTPLFEDDDHDSLLLEADDCDCLQPEDYDTLQEENEGVAPPGDICYDAPKENENPAMTQEGLVDRLSMKREVQSAQDFFLDFEKVELDPGERIRLHSGNSYKVNGQLLESGSERESMNNLEGDDSDSLTDYGIVGSKESISAPLKFDDTGCWRERKEEYGTAQEFKFDTGHLDSMQNEELCGGYTCDSNDQDDDHNFDNDGSDEGIEGENEKPTCQDEAEDTDNPSCATTVKENRSSHENQSINKMFLLDKMHNYNSLENQQGVNVLQLESTSKSSLVPERSSLPGYTVEVVRKSKDLSSCEMLFKNILLPVIKDTESENIFGPVNILHNTNVCSASELDDDLMNVKFKLIEGLESTDSVKDGGQYFENVMFRVDSSFDETICPEPDLEGTPSEESHLSPTAAVTNKGHQGHGRDVINKKDDNNVLIEDETSIHETCSNEKVLMEGLVDDKYLKLLPCKSKRESLDSANSQFPYLPITNKEEQNQKGNLKKATMTLKDEQKNLQTMVNESPVQFENLEEIFDASISKVISDDMSSDVMLSEGTPTVEKDSLTDRPEKELDLFTYLKHCAKSVKAKDVLKPKEDSPSCILAASPPMGAHLQFEVSDTIEKTALTHKVSSLHETVQWNDLCTKESISEEETEVPELTPERDESPLLVLPLSNVEGLGKNNDFVQSDISTNGKRNGNSCINKKGRMEQVPPKEEALSPGLQEKEVRVPELPQVFIEDVKDIFRSRLKDGHVNPQEAGETSTCADIKILIQNLVKRVSTSQTINEASKVPSDSKIGDCSEISPMNNSPDLKEKYRDDGFCISSLKSELLLDILKQNQDSQKIMGAFELIREVTQIGCNLEKRAIPSKVLSLQLEHIFYKLLADAYSEQVQQVGDLNQKSSAASDTVGEKPHILDDLKSKEGNHCSSNLQNVKEIGQENSTVCASALPRDEKPEALHNYFPNHLECFSGSKGMTSGSSSMEQVS